MLLLKFLLFYIILMSLSYGADEATPPTLEHWGHGSMNEAGMQPTDDPEAIGMLIARYVIECREAPTACNKIKKDTIRSIDPKKFSEIQEEFNSLANSDPNSTTSELIHKAKSTDPDSFEYHFYGELASMKIKEAYTSVTDSKIEIIGKEEIEFLKNNDVPFNPISGSFTLNKAAVEYEINEHLNNDSPEIAASKLVCKMIIKAIKSSFDEPINTTNLKTYLSVTKDYKVNEKTQCGSAGTIEKLINEIEISENEKSKLLSALKEKKESIIFPKTNVREVSASSASSQFKNCNTAKDFANILNLCDISRSLAEFSERIETSRLKTIESEKQKNSLSFKNQSFHGEIEIDSTIPSKKENTECNIKLVQSQLDQAEEQSYRNIGVQITFKDEAGKSRTYSGYPIDIDELLIEIAAQPAKNK